jgi:hypothetical protein
MSHLLTMPTAFEREVRRLGLNEQTCVASRELRQWCERNKDVCYIPEWLLKRWGMSVDSGLDSDPGPSRATTLFRRSVARGAL